MQLEKTVGRFETRPRMRKGRTVFVAAVGFPGDIRKIRLLPRAQLALCQSRQRPVVLGHQLIDYIAALQFLRQDFPRISFHLKMTAEVWLSLDDVHHAKDVVSGIVE